MSPASKSHARRSPAGRARVAGMGAGTGTGRRARIRTLFFAVYIACTLGANAVLLIPFDPSGEIGDNTVFSASWILLHLVSVLVLLTSKHLRAVPLFIALSVGGLVVLSAAWSVSWMDSLVYGGMAAGNILIACLLAAEYSLKQITHLLLRVLIVLVIAGMLLALVGYDQVRDFDPHARENFLGGQPIRGFFQHNIMAGFYAATGAVLSMTLLRGVWRAAVVGVFVLFALLAGSATGLLLMAAAVVLVPLARLVVPKVPLGGLVTVLVPTGVALGSLAWQAWVPVLELVGRDPTLTGRTILWEWGWQAIAERPVLGWGFTGYFHSAHGDMPSLYVPQFLGYEISHFHNSYIQTAVDLGVVGLLILTVVLLYTTAKSYAHARGRELDVGLGALMVMVIFLIASPTEFLFINYNHFGTFTLFALFFSLFHNGHQTAGNAQREDGQQ